MQHTVPRFQPVDVLGVQQLSRVSRKQRYNTLDFAEQNRVPTGMLRPYDEIADQIFKLREQREKCTVDTAARDAQIQRINDLQDFIKQQRTNLAEFDEALVKRWLKQIIVWEDHCTVELKSGLKVDVER